MPARVFRLKNPVATAKRFSEPAPPAPSCRIRLPRSQPEPLLKAITGRAACRKAGTLLAPIQLTRRAIAQASRASRSGRDHRCCAPTKVLRRTVHSRNRAIPDIGHEYENSKAFDLNCFCGLSCAVPLACTQAIPEFQLYETALGAQFEQGNEVLDRVAAAERIVVRRSRLGGNGITDFNPDDAAYHLDTGDPPVAASIRGSLKSLKAYNDVLGALANGEAAAALGARAGTLVNNMAGAAGSLSAHCRVRVRFRARQGP